MSTLADQVSEYFIALIVGVILLYVLWEVILVVAADVPALYKYGIAIAIAAATALVVIAKRGIE